MIPFVRGKKLCVIKGGLFYIFEKNSSKKPTGCFPLQGRCSWLAGRKVWPSISNKKGFFCGCFTQWVKNCSTVHDIDKCWLIFKILKFKLKFEGISQFYLHTSYSSANGISHTCLCLPSRSWYSFTDPGGKAELALGGWLVTYRNKCPAPGTEPGHSRLSQY